MRRRRLIFALLGLLVVLALLSAWAAARRRAWAESAVIATAWASGVHPVAVRVESIGLAGAVLRDLRVGEAPDLWVDRVTFAWSPRDLLARRAAVATLEDARLRVLVGGEGGFSLGALDPLLEDDGEEGGDPLAARVRVVRGEARVTTLAGPILVEGVTADLDLGAGGRAPAGGTLEVGAIRDAASPARFPLLAAAARAEPDAPGAGALRVGFHVASEGDGLRVEGAGLVVPDAGELDLELRLLPAELGAGGLALASRLPEGAWAVSELAGRVAGEARLRAPGAGGEPFTLRAEAHVADAGATLAGEAGALHVEGLGAALEIDEAGPSRVALRSLRLRDGARRPRFGPVDLRGEAERGAEAWRVALRAEAAGGKAQMRAEGRARLGPPGFEGRVVVEPFRFGKGGVDVAALAPALAASVASASGGLSGSADVRAPGAGDAPFDVEGELVLDGFGVRSVDGARLRGLRGRVRFAGPAPWRTAGAQTLRFDRVDLIGTLSEGLLAAAVTDRQVAVDAFECGFASGRLKGMGVFDADRGHGMALEIDGVDLGELLAVLEIPDLSATGTISGVVPLYSEGDALRIAASLAAAPAGGTIRYLPATGAAARLGVAGDLGMLAEALEDFHYDALSMGLEGDLAGDAVLRASLRGRNPSVEGGRPIHLNLRIETHVPSLLLGASASTRLPDVLERRLRDRVEQR